MTTIVVSADADRAIPTQTVDDTINALRHAVTDPGMMHLVDGADDPRVRLLPLASRHALVLFEIVGGADGPDLLLLGVYALDEAADVARRTRLRVHPGTGVPRIEGPRRENAPPPAAEPLLAGLGVTRQILVDRLGIQDPVADAALACIDETQVLGLAARAPQRSQGETLRCLAAGSSADEVAGLLEFAGVDPGAADGDAVIRSALRGRASRMNYALVDADEPRDLVWMLRGIDRDQWRAFLHPAQRRHVESRHAGPARVTGGAGTGKTVVLLHRARELWRRYPGSRIVLTTFTTTLASDLVSDLTLLDPRLPLVYRLGEPGIHVTHVDSLVERLLHREWPRLDDSAHAVLGVPAGHLGRECLLRSGTERWKQALAAAGPGLPGWLRHVAFVEEEYESVILPRAITDVEEYLRTRRTGRGARLGRPQRRALWDVVRAYRSASRAEGVLDFAEAAALTAHRLGARARGGRYVDHLLVDEAQDLSGAHWQLVRHLTEPGPDDVFVAEDTHQRIYPRKVAPVDLGMRFGPTRRLELAYRTTAETLRWATRVLDGQTFADLAGEDQSHDYRATRSGELPRLVPAATADAEREAAVDILRSWLTRAKSDDIAVLVRTKSMWRSFGEALDEAGIAWQAAEDGAAFAAGRVTVMTMHRAKGVEFPRILIVGAGKAELPAWPARDLPPAAGGDDARLRERSLVYVSATRARDALAVTWTREPSPMLPPRGWDAPGVVRARLPAPGPSWRASS